MIDFNPFEAPRKGRPPRGCPCHPPRPYTLVRDLESCGHDRFDSDSVLRCGACEDHQLGSAEALYATVLRLLAGAQPDHATEGALREAERWFGFVRQPA